MKRKEENEATAKVDNLNFHNLKFSNLNNLDYLHCKLWSSDGELS